MISIVCWELNDLRGDTELFERFLPDWNKSDSSLLEFDSDLPTSSGIEKTKELIGIYGWGDDLDAVELESFIVLCL